MNSVIGFLHSPSHIRGFQTGRPDQVGDLFTRWESQVRLLFMRHVQCAKYVVNSIPEVVLCGFHLLKTLMLWNFFLIKRVNKFSVPLVFVPYEYNPLLR